MVGLVNPLALLKDADFFIFFYGSQWWVSQSPEKVMYILGRPLYKTDTMNAWLIS